MGHRLYVIVLSILGISLTFAQDDRSFNEFIDSSVKPCEDFYEYACGKWSPLNDEATDVINDQRQENRNIMKAFFNSLKTKGTHEKHPPSKFYFLCLDSKNQLDQEILSNYMSTLYEYSDWPYINETFDGSKFDWLQTAAKLRQHQVNTFFRISVRRNWQSSENHHVMYLTPLEKPFMGSAYGDEAFLFQTYTKYLLLAFKVKVRKAKEYAQEVVEFEEELDKLREHLDEKLIEPFSIEELARQFPQTNWKLYFKTLLGGTETKKPPQIIVDLKLLKKLDSLIENTKPETLALYQLSKFLRHYHVKMDPPTWMDCMDEVSDKMPLSVADDFDSSTANDLKARQVFEALQEEFIEHIKRNTWYSAKTKGEIVDKLESLRVDIGISDPGIMLELEESIDMSNFQQARMALDKLAAENEFSQLRSYNKIASDNLKPLKVNAYYKLTTNVLEIPIGLLRSPLYRVNASEAQIMGSLGSILGHELVHGLDYDGQNYDQDGNVIMDVNAKDIIQFGKRANCFIDQYGGNGAVLNEDVADSEGLRLAYAAFEKMQNKKSVPSSRFTDKQLFYLSYAQIWCQNGEKTTRPTMHSAHKDRVNKVVANSEGFAEAFTCKMGSKLNPDKKCQIW